MNKQIEEMANDYYEAMLKAKGALCSMNEGAPKWYAKALYNAGYRKSTDVAREVAEQFKETAKQYLLEKGLYLAVFKNALNHAEAELKKKYEGEGADDE